LFPFDGVFPLLKATLPIAVLTLLLVLSQRLGILTVSALLGDSATGIFSSATRIVDGLKLGHYAVLGGLLPILARRTDESEQTFRLGFFILIALSMSMAIGLSLLSGAIILFLFGTDYSSAIPLLSMLGWSLIPYTISSFISYDLIARRQEHTLVKATAISLAIVLVLNIWLVSAYHLTGTVYAALVGETVQAILFILFRNSLRSKSPMASASSQQPETT
jgi:O-antigen/teichoic acid export membrane protein